VSCVCVCRDAKLKTLACTEHRHKPGRQGRGSYQAIHIHGPPTV
jgi:hypothetical protein